MKPPHRRFRFLYRSGDRYYWRAEGPIDSRTEHVSCSVDWYWSKP